MISKNKIKYISSLEHKKARRQWSAFVAEGPKVVGDLLAAGFVPETIVATQEWLQTNRIDSAEVIEVSQDELRKVSFLQHPQQVLATFRIPKHINETPDNEWFGSNLCLMLDGVQDPGNLGTIIRIADWFGIDTIICSNETADAYAPKVIQATMGSIARVKVIYTDIKAVLSAIPDTVPVYGTLLDGKNIYDTTLNSYGIIIMGNEGNGISQEVRQLVTHRLLIPSFPPERPTAESLNVAIATAIVCAEFRRRS